MTADAVRAYEVWLAGHEEHRSVYLDRTVGRARYRYLLDIGDCFPDGLPFELLRSRSLGAPRFDPDLHRVAMNRGRPDLATPGRRVRVCCAGCPPALGRVVAGNSSGNVDVLFDDDVPGYGGRVYNVHPGEVESIDEEGRHG